MIWSKVKLVLRIQTSKVTQNVKLNQREYFPRDNKMSDILHCVRRRWHFPLSYIFAHTFRNAYAGEIKIKVTHSLHLWFRFLRTADRNSLEDFYLPRTGYIKSPAALYINKFSDQLATVFLGQLIGPLGMRERRDEENRGWATFQGHARQRSLTPFHCVCESAPMGENGKREECAPAAVQPCFFFFPCVPWFILFC